MKIWARAVIVGEITDTNRVSKTESMTALPMATWRRFGFWEIILSNLIYNKTQIATALQTTNTGNPNFKKSLLE